ncbi:MAG: flippase-like domain-containing protein [Lentimicrobium sp.]|uniref:lysylphosphatidylglycerol synthase domain-containing protein n=1 Tax=Lentimicrobium sp. TaxID=2034841 RepID=UPI0025FA8796|nr:lysylphosphatidylglycerol synthase domain-containing protein [Lentimicrobium sp.]MCO5256151.1 flippase-like domain-containing protein [Lentimicrobium sp.]MCO5263253.1 flippase-like domain-containing protein [Lentimicrobium sp.]
MKLSAKVKKTLNSTARILIVAASCWFIYRQVFVQADFAQFRQQLALNLQAGSFRLLLLAVLLMMPLNWLLETVKWRSLISYLEPVSLPSAFRSVLAGITFSLFTPNRVGEFLGRIFTLRANRIKSALLTIAGSISQLIVTLVAGMIALLFFIPQYAGFSEGWQDYLYAGLVIFILLFSLLLILFFLKVPVITARLDKLIRPKWRRMNLYLIVIERVGRRTLGGVLLLSALRYLVFSAQFYLLLRAFGLNIPYPQAMMLISVTYFVMAAIPTVALADLGIRGSVSIYFIGMFFGSRGDVAASILSASTMIWMINLALPALFGALFIRKISIIRKS